MSSILGYRSFNHNVGPLFSRSRLFQRYTRYSTTVNIPQQSNSTTTPSSSSTKKRKVVLVGSYVGTNYYGLTMTQDEIAHPSIEHKIQRALHASGAMIPTNNLQKIDWTTSSRTDKGVHASRVLVAGKLELKDETPQAYEDVVKDLNDNLPEHIRFFSCTRIPNSFIAKDACHTRTYEYFLPLPLLLNNLQLSSLTPTQLDDILTQVNTLLHKFVGRNSVHNFHRVSRKLLTPHAFSSYFESMSLQDIEDYLVEDDSSLSNKLTAEDIWTKMQSFYQLNFEEKKKKRELKQQESKQLHEEFVHNMTFIDKEKKSIDNSTDNTTNYNMYRNYYDDWKPRSSDVYSQTITAIYKCYGEYYYPPSSTTNTSSDGNNNTQELPYIKIRIIGKSFLLHQIRLMISAMILTFQQKLPNNFIDFALLTPLALPLPLAPAQGLVLTNTLLNQIKGQDGYLSEYSSYYAQHPDVIQRQNLTKNDLYIMTKPQYEQSELFLQQMIYPEIVRLWKASNVSEQWLQESYQYDLSVSSQAKQLTDNIFPKLNTLFQYISQQKENLRCQKEFSRQQFSLTSFSDALIAIANELQINVDLLQNNDIRVKKFLIKNLSRTQANKLYLKVHPYHILPNGFATDLSIYFQLYHSPIVQDTILSLIFRIYIQDLPLTNSSLDYFQFLQKETGITDEERSNPNNEIIIAKKIMTWLSTQTRLPEEPHSFNKKKD